MRASFFFFFLEKWKEWCETHRDLQLTPVQDPHCCWSSTANSGTGESTKSECEHNGLVGDCEIAVCQGKTRGQLWEPIAEWVGRDSWKEAPSTRSAMDRAADLKPVPDYMPRSIWPFDLNTAPPPSTITIFHTCVKVIIKSCVFGSFPCI